MSINLNDIVREIIREELPKLMPNATPVADEFLRTKDVAKMTGLSTSFFEVGRSQSHPDRPPYQRVGTAIVYRRSDVLSWMDNRQKKGGAA